MTSNAVIAVQHMFLWRQHSGAPLRDHFVRRPSVCLSVRPSVCLSVRLSHFWFAYNFFTFRSRTFIFGMCVPYDNTFPDGTIDFEHVTLTVTFDLHWENFVCHTFGLPYNFFTFRGRASYLACVFLMTAPFRW